MTEDPDDEIAAKFGMTKEQLVEQANAYVAKIRAQYAWPPDGIMPDEYDRTLLHRINEAVLSKLESLPGLHEISSGWCLQTCECDLGFEHEPSGWWVRVTMEIRPNPDWDDDDNDEKEPAKDE
jgi:hypothetical protein